MKNSGSKTPRFGSSFAKKPRPNAGSNKRDDGSVYVRDDAPRRSGARQEKPQVVQRNKKLGEATIERFGHDGRGITQLNGKTCFVSGALTGETVTLRLENEQPRFIEARADIIINASPERQTPPCQHFGVCGGCELQHIVPVTQLAIKQESVVDQVKRWGGVSPTQQAAPIGVDDGHYRARARLGVWYEDDGQVTLGFRLKGDKKLVSINECYVLRKPLEILLLPLREVLGEFTRTKAITHVELIESTDAVSIILRHTKALNTHQQDALQVFAKAQSVNVFLEPNGDLGLTDILGNLVDPRLTYSLHEEAISLQFHPQDFTQVNPALNERMIARALELMDLRPTDHVVDLFCGMGNFTLPIAKRVKSVLGIEGVSSMVERGTVNATLNGITNAEFLTANLASDNSPRIRNLCAKADVIVLDPPRDGAKEIAAQLRDLKRRGQLKARRIVYISCNPATLARDTALLVDAGFTLENLGALDMFPHTQHVESIALFIAK